MKQDTGAVQIVPLRYRGRWFAAAIIVIILGGLLTSMVSNPRFRWGTVGKYLFDDSIIAGLFMTIGLTVAAMTIGIILGTIIALMRLANNPVLSSVAFGYLWLFRGTPLLVQLIFWFNLSALYPQITLGFPFGPSLGSLDTNMYISVYVAAILGLGLNEGAYMSEIVRSGINAVAHGQREAAQALGMTGFRVMWRIILPQAMRVIVPPTGNQLIGMLKTTSLVSVIALQDLLYSAQLIYAANFQTIPLLIVASIWYLVLTTILTIIQYFVERHFGKSDREASKSAVQETINPTEISFSEAARNVRS